MLWAVLFSVLCRGQDGNYGIGVPNSLRPVLEVKPTAVSGNWTLGRIMVEGGRGILARSEATGRGMMGFCDDDANGF